MFHYETMLKYTHQNLRDGCGFSDFHFMTYHTFNITCSTVQSKKKNVRILIHVRSITDKSMTKLCSVGKMVLLYRQVCQHLVEHFGINTVHQNENENENEK